MYLHDLTRLQRLVLEAISKYTNQRDHSEIFLPENIIRYAPKRLTVEILQAGISSCVDAKLITWVGSSEDDAVLRLTPEGAELLLDLQDEIAESARIVPASDRFVDLSDNYSGQSEIALAAQALETATRETNQLTPEADSDDALRRETSGIRAMLSGKRVMAGLLVALRACVERIKMIAARVQAKAVEAAADRLFVLLTEFLQGLGLL
jgi:hypothetical protein